MINGINDEDKDCKTILKDATTYQKRIIYNFFVSFLEARKNNFSLDSMHNLQDAIYRLYRNLYKDIRILDIKATIKDFISNINQFSEKILTHSLPQSFTQAIMPIQNGVLEEMFVRTQNAIKNIKKPDSQTLSLHGVYDEEGRGEIFKNILKAYDELMKVLHDNKTIKYKKINNLISAIIKYLEDYKNKENNIIWFQRLGSSPFVCKEELNIAFINYYGYKMPPLVKAILDEDLHDLYNYTGTCISRLMNDISDGKIKTYDQYKEEQDDLAKQHLNKLFNINTPEDLLNFNHSTYCCGCCSYNNDSIYHEGINNDETEINNRYTNWKAQKPYWCCFL